MNTIIWTKPGCPACRKTKLFLMSKGLKYEERVIGDGWTREQFFEAHPNANTVPQITIHGESVGGYTQMLKYAEDHGMWTSE